MRWSHSASRSFRKCQRQWYFKNVVANARAKEPLRRRAYLLSKLQSVSAWRGKIVDDVISKTIIPGINRRSPITLRDAKTRARQLYDTQLAYALFLRRWVIALPRNTFNAIPTRYSLQWLQERSKGSKESGFRLL
jgi:hypothetical protein